MCRYNVSYRGRYLRYELISESFFSIKIIEAIASGSENELEAMKYLQHIFIEHVRLRYIINVWIVEYMFGGCDNI